MDKTILFALPLALIIAGGAWYFFNSAAHELEATSPIDLYGYNADEGEQGRAQAAVQASTQEPVPTTINDNQQIMQATLHTNKGDITIEFLGADAPNTVANFTKLAKEGFYNGTKFHRVIAGFMVQGGDPLTKDDSQAASWGTGGPGYQFADEIHAQNRNMAGTIAMANAGPNTNGSQFFINVADNNFLDPKHTVFGRVTAGMDVVKAIEAVPVGQADRPLEAVVITSVEVK